MASFPQQCCAEYHAEDEPSDTQETPASAKISLSREREYDFVETPSQDHLCPITLELLRDPHQTTCCGQHLSLEAATRLKHDRKPCPMCNERNLTTVPDKFYKRKINALKVRCPYKGSGCGWVGEVGSVDQHSTSCPRRPWKCDFCTFQGTYEVGTNNHLPICVKYPEPCPNQCEIGTIPRCKVDQHLTKCPLQLVECEFTKFGCQERVLRQDLAHHMEEGAQRHLRCMTLFNLRLTRELNQQMTEKDQQMAEKDEWLAEKDEQMDEKDQQLAEKDHQLASLMEQNKKLQEQNRKLQEQVLQQGKQNGKQLQELGQKMFAYDRKVVILQTELEWRDKQMKEQLEKCMKTWQDQVPKQQLRDETHVQVHQDLVITAYSTKKRRPNNTPPGTAHYYECISDPFYCQKYGFEFNIDVFQNCDVRAYFSLLTGHNDHCLPWPIKCTVQLLLLNQLGDYGHHLAVVTKELGKADRDRDDWIVIKEPFANSAELQFNARRHTLYLKNDSLHFRLYLNVYG